MTQTSTHPSATPAAALYAVLITFLSPMFVMGSGGDIAMARLAATQVVNSYAGANALQLFAVVQIVAFGICSLGSLSLSMAEDLSLSLILRLRGNAVALSRAGAWHQKTLDAARQEAEFNAACASPQGSPSAAYDAAIREPLPPAVGEAAVGPAPTPAIVQHPPSAEAAPVPASETEDTGRQHPTAAAAHPAGPPHYSVRQPATGADNLTPEDRYWRSAWADAMTVVADEYAQTTPAMTPAQRAEASVRADVLRMTAGELRSGAPRPPGILPSTGTAARSTPGDRP